MRASLFVCPLSRLGLVNIRPGFSYLRLYIVSSRTSYIHINPHGSFDMFVLIFIGISVVLSVFGYLRLWFESRMSGRVLGLLATSEELL